MPEKVYVKTPWEYLAAYRNGTSYSFLYYEGDPDELPVYLAQKSAEGDAYAMYLYHWHLFRLSTLHYTKRIHDRTLGRDEYGPKGFVYLRAAAEAGVPDAVEGYEREKKHYTFPIYQYPLPEFNPYNDYINERLRYEKTKKEQKAQAQPLDYGDYINKKLQKLAAEKAMKQGHTQASVNAASSPKTEQPAPIKKTKTPAQAATETQLKQEAKKPVQPIPAPTQEEKPAKKSVTAATEPVKDKKDGLTVFDPKEQFMLGVKYMKGDGVQQDYKKALYYFQLSAEQGAVSAMLNVGICYEHGWGTEKDYQKAIEYYRMAAQKGSVKALCLWGALEVFFEENYEGGIRHLTEAYEKGYVGAAYSLGHAYTFKNSPTYSVEKAIAWFEKSAAAGEKAAYSQLGWLYQKNVKTDDGRRNAVKWYEKAYQNGDKEVCTSLGSLYEKLGEYDAAYEWLRKAQLAGDSYAVEMIKILDHNRCPHCRAFYSKTYKKGLFGTRCVCSKCGKKIKEEE